MPTGHTGFDQFIDGLDDFVTGGTITPAWSPDGKSLAFLEGTPEDRRGWLVDLDSGKTVPLVADIIALRDAIREATGQTPPGRGCRLRTSTSKLPAVSRGWSAPPR